MMQIYWTCISIIDQTDLKFLLYYWCRIGGFVCYVPSYGFKPNQHAINTEISCS